MRPATLVRTLSSILLLVLIGASSADAAIAPPPPNEKWVKVVSGEFRVFSNASARDAKRVATDLVRMRQALGKLTKMRVHSKTPVYVIAFRDERSLAPYRTAIFGREEVKFRGVFLPRQHANFVVMNVQRDEGADRIVYHELTHHFVNNTVGALPSWVAEGLAQYYETFRVRSDDVDIGFPIKEHVAMLQRAPLLPLDQLFTIAAADKAFDEGSRRTMFYAQSWALTHYLLVGKEGAREKMPAIVGLVRGGTSAEQAIASTLGMSLKQLSQELHTYVRRPTMSYRTYELAELDMPAIDDAVPAERSEVLAALGNLLLNTRESSVADASLFAHEAIAASPDSPDGYALLGEIAWRQEKRQEAAVAFEKAISVGSSDPHIYLNYGSLLMQQMYENGATVGETTDELLKIRKVFERAAELDPTSARALGELGATYSMAHDVAGIPFLEKSLQLAPDQTSVAMNLSNLYRIAGRVEEADRLVKRPPTQVTSPAARQVIEAMRSRELEQAGQLVQQGKTEEAIPLLRKALETTRSPSLKKQIEELLRELEKPQKRNPQLDVMLAADEKMREGRLSEALRILDALLPEVKDESLRRHIELKRESILRKMNAK